MPYSLINNIAKTKENLPVNYIFDDIDKPIMQCDISGKSKSSITCYVRDYDLSKTISDKMRIRKLEFKEICSDLGKSITNTQCDSEFIDFINTGMIIIPGKNAFICKVISVFPDLSLHFSAIKPFNIVLSSLEGKSGFLGIQYGKIVPLSLNNPDIEDIPLIGVWISSTVSGMNPKSELVISTILKFIFSQRAKLKGSQDGSTFVYVNFCNKNSQHKFYSFQINPAPNPWVMLVSSSEVTSSTPLKLKLTTNKIIANNQGDCSLYKLSRTISIIEGKETKHRNSSIKNPKKVNDKENKRRDNSVDRLIKKSTKDCLRTIPHKTPIMRNSTNILNSRCIQRSCSIERQITNKSNTLNGLRQSNAQQSSMPIKGGYTPGSKGNNRSFSFAKKIISQQQEQIKVLQQQIFQAMNTIKEFQVRGKPRRNPTIITQESSLFDMNARFKLNMENCQGLNIANDLGQASPNFMKDDEIKINIPSNNINNQRCSNLKMLSSIKETTESATSLGNNFIDGNELSKNFTLGQISFNENI